MLNIFLVVFAPFFGSFAALVAHRWPKGLRIIAGRSRCDQCEHALSARDLVPLLSFVWLRGRCRHCGARIPWLSPIVEISALFLALWALSVVPSEGAWVTILLGWALLLLAATDFTSLRLPDAVTLPLIPAGLAYILLFVPADFYGHLIAAISAYLLFRLIDFLYTRWRGREGLGQGDAKLFAAAGAWVGPYALASVLFIAAVAGLSFAVGRGLVSKSEEHRVSGTLALPFGAFLGLGFWLVWLYGPLVFG